MDYLFDPDVIHECALAGIGKPKPEMFDAIADAMEAAYPGRIERTQPWLYSIAGGAMIQMKLYYASVFEYLMIWGTPIGSEGHSGRHAVGFWDTVIDGETWYYAEGQFEKRVYRPGDRIWVGPGQARAMNFTDGVWAVEYARGPLPLSVPFGIADEILSTLDFRTAGLTLGMYMELIGHHWKLPMPDGRAAALPRRALGGLVRGLGSVVSRVCLPDPPDDEIPTGDGRPRVAAGRAARRALPAARTRRPAARAGSRAAARRGAPAE
jgi:C-8 sterol isomerase